jgi:hypothetical protein
MQRKNRPPGRPEAESANPGFFPFPTLKVKPWPHLLFFPFSPFSLQLLDGDTAALPPAVAPLAGHFTDGGVTCALSGGGSAPPTSGGLVGWAASVWRYRGLS